MILLLFMMCLNDDTPTIQEEMSVIARTLKVQVLDRKNQPITGLGQDRFELRVNGEPREFYLTEMDYSKPAPAEAATEKPAGQSFQTTPAALAPPVTSPRTFALYWEPSLMSPTGFEAVRNSMQVFLKELRPVDVVRVYYGDRSLLAVTSFTRDKEAAATVLNAQQQKSGFLVEYRQVVQELRKQTNEWVQLSEQRAGKGMAAEQNSMMNEIKNSIDHSILVRDRMLDTLAKTQQSSLDAIREDLQLLKGEKSIMMFTSGGIFTTRLKREFEETSAKLTGASIPVNILVFKNKELDMSATRRQRTRPTTRRVDESQSNIGSQQATDRQPTNSDSRGFSNSVEDVADRDRLEKSRIEMDDGLVYTAGQTGGAFLRMNNSSLAAKMAGKLAGVANHYYNLTYLGDESGSFDEIKLKLKGRKRGRRLIYGNHLKMRTAREARTAEMQRTFESELLNLDPMEDTFYRHGNRVFLNGVGGARAAMYVHLTGEDFPEAGYQLGFAAFDSGDNLLDYRETTLLKPDKEETLKLYDLLVTNAPPARLRTYVRNLDTGKRSLYEDKTDPVRSAADFSTPTLTLKDQKAINTLHFHTVDDLTKLNPTGLSADRRKMSDPFILDQRLLSSDIDTTFATGNKLHVFTHVQHADLDLPKYRIRADLNTADGSKSVQLKPLLVRKLDPKTYALLAELDVAEAQAGEYELAMYIAAPNQTKEAVTKVAFTLNP